MIRKAFGLATALVFLASFAAPLCPAAAPGAAHSCCGGPAKKAPAGPAGSCCRLAAPSSSRPVVSSTAFVLIHPSPAVLPPLGVLGELSAARSFVSDAAPPNATGLSPPARA